MLSPTYYDARVDARIAAAARAALPGFRLFVVPDGQVGVPDRAAWLTPMFHGEVRRSDGGGTVAIAPADHTHRAASITDLAATLDAALAAREPIALGDPETDGSWRIARAGPDLAFQRREGGAWITKASFSA